MMDRMMGFAPIPVMPPGGETRIQRVSGGTAVVDQGNASQRLISPAGISRGLPLNASDIVDNDIFTGRVSLGMMGAGLLLIMALYLWTRNVQGGG